MGSAPASIGAMVPAPVGSVRFGTLPGRGGDPQPEADERDTERARGARADRERLLGEHDHRDDRHPEQAHDPDREEHEHERPAAPGAPDAVLGAHHRRAAHPGPRAREEQVERAPAVPQADRLERRELVDAGGDDRPSRDVRARALPRQERGSSAATTR